MIVDLGNERFSDMVHRRICVVGTGIGGGSFIDRYLKKKDDIVVIEAGSTRENTSIRSDSVGRGFGLPITREISLGGTSNVWRGLCSPLDGIDFTTRRWINKSGWPVDQNDMEPYYVEACKILGLPGFSYFVPNQIDAKLRALEHGFDFDRSLFSNKYFLHKRPPTNFRHNILQHFDSRKKLLLMNTVAVEIITNREGSVVEKILAKSPRGETIEIYAKYFVISAGALETPRLLLNSRRWNNKGIGNNYNLVGRFLMDHPMGSLSQIRLEKIRKAQLYHSVNLISKQHIKTGLVLTEALQEQYRLPNHCVYLWPSFRRGIDDRFERLRRTLITSSKKKLKLIDILTLISNPNSMYRILSYLFPIDAYYKFADLFFVTEQIPNQNSMVSLSDAKDRFGYPIAKIKWIISEKDLKSINIFNELALKALSFGKHQVSFRKHKIQINETLTSAAHHMGTTRMADDKKNGVVDENLKVWGVHNLFICDASVFPTSGNANPALTICALAVRLSDMLVKKQ